MKKVTVIKPTEPVRIPALEAAIGTVGRLYSVSRAIINYDGTLGMRTYSGFVSLDSARWGTTWDREAIRGYEIEPLVEGTVITIEI